MMLGSAFFMVTRRHVEHVSHDGLLDCELEKQKSNPNFFLKNFFACFAPYISFMLYMATPKTAQSRSRYMMGHQSIENRLCCMAIAVPPCNNCGAWFLTGDLGCNPCLTR
jgi:hypothetical protein